MDLKKLNYPIEEAAQLLGVGRTKVYELMSDGRLEHIKIGRSRFATAAGIIRLQEQFLADAKNHPLRVKPAHSA